MLSEAIFSQSRFFSYFADYVMYFTGGPYGFAGGGVAPAGT